MQLLLLRHGKSDWSVAYNDIERPLTQRGKKNAKRIGKFLVEQSLLANKIICSPANRAHTTALFVAQQANIVDRIEVDERLYFSSIEKNLQIIRENIQLDRLMLVGHNPIMEMLVEHFVPNIEIPDDGKLMPTAALSYFELDPQLKLSGDYFIQRAKFLY